MCWLSAVVTVRANMRARGRRRPLGFGAWPRHKGRKREEVGKDGCCSWGAEASSALSAEGLGWGRRQATRTGV